MGLVTLHVLFLALLQQISLHASLQGRGSVIHVSDLFCQACLINHSDNVEPELICALALYECAELVFVCALLYAARPCAIGSCKAGL